MTRRIKTRCCGLTLQTGTKIIGIVSLIAYLIQLAISIIQSSALNFQTDSIDTVHAFVCIATAIVSSSLIPCSVLLLNAVFSNYRPVFLVPWLVVEIALRCIHAHILISGIHLAATSAVSHGVATVFVMTCALSLETYMWWIVLCYYRELRKHETICRGAAPAELVACKLTM